MQTTTTVNQQHSLAIWVTEWLASSEKEITGDDAMRMLVYMGILGIVDFFLQVVLGVTLARAIQELIAIIFEATTS